MHSRPFGLAALCLAAAPLACGDAAGDTAPTEELGSVQQPVAANIGLPDWNFDGVIDGTDAVSYLQYYGIQFETYRLTDDVHNTASNLPRRPWDQAVKTISEHCLDAQYGGTEVDEYPLEEIPGIVTFAENMTRMPQQFLREIGRKGYRLHVYGHIGRLTKRWDLTINQGKGSAPIKGELVFFRSGNAHVGKICTAFDSGHTCIGGWETLSSVTFNPFTGAVSFSRIGQTFTGTVNAAHDGLSMGTAISGSYQLQFNPGAVYTWSATPKYQTGGTTQVGGFGTGSTSACEVSSNGEVIGRTDGLIMVGVKALAEWNGVHEIAHAIESMIHDNDQVPLYDTDDAAFDQVFPGGMACVKDGSCALEGSGYYSRYGAGNEMEDFAEVYTAHVLSPTSLQARIDQDAVANGSTALESKRTYLVGRIDLPDPPPAAAVHPADGSTYRFATRHGVRWSKPGTSPALLPVASSTHAGVTAVSNGTDRLWLFRIGIDGLTYVRAVYSGGSFGAWTSVGTLGRVPVAATLRTASEVLLVYPDDDGAVRYRTMNPATGAVSWTGTLGGFETNQPLAIATRNGITYVFGLDDAGEIHYTYFGATITPAPWASLGKQAHSIAAVAATPPGKASAVYLLAVDQDLLVEHLAVSSPTTFGAWKYETSYATVFAAPAMTSKGELYIKGFDGNVYTKLLDSVSAATLVSGL